MNHLSINAPPTTVELSHWRLAGQSILESEKRLKDLTGVFGDEVQCRTLDQETLVYRVQACMPAAEGTPGGLFLGTTVIQPGKVGSEYFMTRGHLHLNVARGEFYWGVRGDGMLILMNDRRETWAETMFPGSVHYINGGIAHRVANVGREPLIFGASWPSDAGHDYDKIARSGFSARLLEVAGKPTLVAGL